MAKFDATKSIIVAETPAVYSAKRPQRRMRSIIPESPGKERSVVRTWTDSRRAQPSETGFTPSEVIEKLAEGLPFQELELLRESLDLPMERLAPLLGISKATLHRRKMGGRLGQDESDRVVRFARLVGRATEVMESEAAARQWLRSPQFGLGGSAPLDFARTEVGAREVEDLLGRIEHGVYS